MAKSVSQLQNLMNHFVTFCQDNGLAINTEKTVCMLVNCSGSISVLDVTLEEVTEFRYLGLVLSNTSVSPLSIMKDRLNKCKLAFYSI